MPIKGLTDVQVSFPQLGTIRKGAEKPEGDKRPGADLDYFRFSSDDVEAVKAFEQAYGKKPVAVHAFLPYETTNENFEAWQEAWNASSLLHRCDGERTVLFLLPNGTYTTEPRPCPGGCKHVGRLKIIIPELKRLAYVSVMTTSKHDIMQIWSNLQAIGGMKGTLTGIPLIVRRVPREISTPGADGKRVRREKWLIQIEAQPEWVQLQLQAAAEAARPVISGGPVIPALPAWEGDDDDDVIDVPVAALPPVVDRDADKRLEIDAKNLSLMLHNGDKKAASDFYTKHLTAATFEQRQELYLALNSKDRLIQEVEARIHALVELGYAQEQIQKILDDIGLGTSFDDMSESQLITLCGGIYKAKGGKR